MRRERSDEEVRLALLEVPRPTEPPDPLAMVTVAETAQASGVPGSTLAYHFETPEELRHAVHEEILGRFDDRPSVAIHDVVCDALAADVELAHLVSIVSDALVDHLRTQATTRWILGAVARAPHAPLAAQIWRRHGSDVARLFEQLAASRRQRIGLEQSVLGATLNASLAAGWLAEEVGLEPTEGSSEGRPRIEIDGVRFGHAGVLIWSRLRRVVERRP